MKLNIRSIAVVFILCWTQGLFTGKDVKSNKYYVSIPEKIRYLNTLLLSEMISELFQINVYFNKYLEIFITWTRLWMVLNQITKDAVNILCYADQKLLRIA